MTTETQFKNDLHFPLLTEAAYLAAVQKAETAIRDHIQAPTMEHYAKTTTTAYPIRLRRGITGFLILVMLLTFLVSAGKQAAAMGLLLDHLPDKFSHLSDKWVFFSILAWLLLSEIGAMLFLVSRVLVHD